MKTIQIPQDSDPGKTIARIADMFHINADSLLTGLLYSLLSTEPATLTITTPAPAPLPTPAPVIPDRTETERRLGAID